MLKQKNYYQKAGEDMKKYILFGFWNYYPAGGLNDIITTFNDMEELNNKKIEDVPIDCDQYQILNLENGNQKSIRIPYGQFDDLDLNWDQEEEMRRENLASFIRSFFEEE
jgi:hypothetical protein